MALPDKITRRTMLHTAIGVGAGLLGGGLLTGAVEKAACRTPEQASGPFYPKRDQPDKDLDLTRIAGRADRAQGKVVYISGQVLDQDLAPVAGALVEIWQANTHGRYHHEDDPNTAPEDPAFQGWGMMRTDAEGRYGFKTIVPGAYPAEEGWVRPPHIHFKVARRGYHELITQMYFDGEALNAKDRLLQEIPEAERQRLVVTLTEGRPDDEPGSRRGTFNLVLRRVKPG
ncbi:MAG: hypothetical protein KatS3mg042_1203 [Rhodothermaceae bacterium]|nr:MAG: hypothetical protein KatS3mg042_1203 [Rhodothermaceae bacterium]